MASITLNKNSVPGEYFPNFQLNYLSTNFPFFSFPVFSVSNTGSNCTVIGDKSAIVPGGIRIGTPALTTRGFTEKDFMLVADFIHEGVKITQEAKKLAPSPKLQDFLKFITAPDFPLIGQVLDLKRRVEDLATQFPLPGV